MRNSHPSSAQTRDAGRILQERSSLARWLSGVLAGEEVTERGRPVAALDHGPLADAARRLCENASSSGPAGPVAREVERVRLFVNAPGGVPAPPYGSWWLEGTLQGNSTVELAEFYRQEGLRTETGTGPADYLPAELEFLHFLLQHQLAANLTFQAELERQTREREREFLERFVLTWVPRFCAEGRAATSEPYWRAVFDLIESLVRAEAERVENDGDQRRERD